MHLITAPLEARRVGIQDRAPYRATITLDLWVWDRASAADLLEQLVREIERKSSVVNGGGSIHHRFVSSRLEDAKLGPDCGQPGASK